jgi:hypothetical protein
MRKKLAILLLVIGSMFSAGGVTAHAEVPTPPFHCYLHNYEVNWGIFIFGLHATFCINGRTVYATDGWSDCTPQFIGQTCNWREMAVVYTANHSAVKVTENYFCTYAFFIPIDYAVQMTVTATGLITLDYGKGTG